MCSIFNQIVGAWENSKQLWKHSLSLQHYSLSQTSTRVSINIHQLDCELEISMSRINYCLIEIESEQSNCFSRIPTAIYFK